MTDLKGLLIRQTVLMLCSTMLIGCASTPPDSVVRPSKITIEQAMKDVASGFLTLDKELDKIEGKLGVVACKIRVTLNLTAGAGENAKIVLGIPGSDATGNVEVGGEATASRGNTVEIELGNPACRPGMKAEEVVAFFEALEKADIKVQWVIDPSAGKQLEEADR